MDEANAALEFEIYRRGVEGYEEQVLDASGRVTKSFRRFSDNLLLALARKRIAGFARTDLKVEADVDHNIDPKSLAAAVRQVAAGLREQFGRLIDGERERFRAEVGERS